jgi:hypothetical protein
MIAAAPLLAGNTLVAVITLSSAPLMVYRQRLGLQADSKTGAWQGLATITAGAARLGSLLTLARASEWQQATKATVPIANPATALKARSFRSQYRMIYH